MKRVGLIFSVAALFLSCSSCDGTSQDESLEGSYRAQRLTVTFRGATGDFLAAGGTFRMDLEGGGRFSAEMDLPDVPEIEGDNTFSASFDGTYTVRGDDLLFFHSEDVFVRDLVWTAGRGTVQTTDSLRNGTKFDVLLRRL